jgi:hypothetical protein
MPPIVLASQRQTGWHVFGEFGAGVRGSLDGRKRFVLNMGDFDLKINRRNPPNGGIGQARIGQVATDDRACHDGCAMRAHAPD